MTSRPSVAQIPVLERSGAAPVLPVLPVRVLFVISGLYRGGAEGLLVAVLNHLVRRRFQPMLCVLHTGSLIQDLRDDVPVFYNLATWAGDVRGLPKLLQILRAQTPTIVDVVGRDDAALWGRLAARLAGVPVVIESLHHGRFSAASDPKRILYHVLNRLLDPWTDAFVAVSQVQRAFYAEIGLAEKQIAVIHNGIDMERFDTSEGVRQAARQALGLPPEMPVVGMVANFSPIKRHDVLLRALVKMREMLPDVRCLLVGDGPLRAAMEKTAQRLGLSGAVSFLGSRPDVPDLLPALDVFCLASDSESFSNAIVEAMAAGKPVVATDCGGPREIVVEGETGFLVPTGQPSALAEKVSFLLRNPALAQQMGQAGRRRAVGCFSLEQMVAARETLFIRLLCEKGVLPQ